MEEGDICGERFFVAKESLPAPLQESHTGCCFFYFTSLIPSEFVVAEE